MNEPAPFAPGTGLIAPEIKTNFPFVPFSESRISTSGNYLIKGLIPSPGLTVVWGPPKCGKSFLMTDALLHVSLDWTYRERRVKSGPVVYLVCEGQQGFPARLEAFRQERMSESADCPPFYQVPTAIDLIKDVNRLIEDIEAVLPDTPPAVVCIDTLNRSLAGSESSDEDMSAYIAAADKIKTTFQCSAIVIHHCGIDGTRPRGHTSLTGAVDAQISVKKGNDGTITAALEYAKDLADGEEFYSRLRVVEVGMDEDGDPITSCVVDESEAGLSQSRLPSSQQARALEMLRRAVEECGQAAPASNHIPENARCVPVDTWRTYCRTGSITTSDTADAAKKAFQRSSEALLRKGIIAMWDSLVWETGQ